MNVFIFQGARLCEQCGHDAKVDLDLNRPNDGSTYDSNDYPKGPLGYGGGEADSPQHCYECHVFLENPLTTDGMTYVIEMIRDNIVESRGSSKVLKEWIEFTISNLRSYWPSLTCFFLFCYE